MFVRDKVLEADMPTMVAERQAPRLVADFDRERKYALLRFADLTNSVSTDQYDDLTFAKIVQHAITYHGLPSSELADAFGVNKGTISRWSAGKNAPQPFARPVVIKWIRDWAKSQADHIKD